jgi:hypothetical protein
MKLDKRHMAVALTLLVGSIVYNVWVFTRPRPRPAGESTPALMAVEGPAPEPVVAAGGGAATIDPAKVAPVADIVLDRAPSWPRNPFVGPKSPVAAETVQTRVDEPTLEPELVLNSVLYSDTRRLAMVNGRRVRVGDVIGTARILDILPNAIVVESPLRGVRTVERRAGRAAASRPSP